MTGIDQGNSDDEEWGSNTQGAVPWARPTAADDFAQRHVSISMPQLANFFNAPTE